MAGRSPRRGPRRGPQRGPRRDPRPRRSPNPRSSRRRPSQQPSQQPSRQRAQPPTRPASRQPTSPAPCQLTSQPRHPQRDHQPGASARERRSDFAPHRWGTWCGSACSSNRASALRARLHACESSSGGGGKSSGERSSAAQKPRHGTAQFRGTALVSHDLRHECLLRLLPTALRLDRGPSSISTASTASFCCSVDMLCNVINPCSWCRHRP